MESNNESINLNKPPLALVVDDDPVLRHLAVKALKKAGIASCEAADGDQAILEFERSRPDILLLDIEMPIIDGYSVCEQIRATPAGSNVPILVLTGHEDGCSIDRAFESGATDFLSKPVNWNLLGYKVRFLLRNAELFQQSERQRQLLEQAEDIAQLGSWHWDFSSQTLTCSSGIRQVLKCSEQVIGLDYYLQQVIEEERSDVEEFIRNWPNSQSPETFEHIRQLTTDEGETVVLQVRGAPCFDASGVFTHGEGTMQDITENARMEQEKQAIREQLEHAQRMESLGTMTGGIAHDFNNSLAAIISNLYLAKMAAKENEALLRRLTTVEEICNRAAELIRSMLTFARNDHTRKSVGDLKTLVNETCYMLCSSMPASIAFRQQIADSPMRCKMNASQLQQVVMNLVNNALFALQEVAEPVLEVSLAPHTPASTDTPRISSLSLDQWLCLQVRDNGCGISAEHLEKIFTPFFTTKEVGLGTGLGLSMAYGAAESHGGFIDVSSQVGKGTTFSIYLPRAVESGWGKPSVSVAQQYTGSGETILIVDDCDTMRLGTASVLRKMGYSVLDASNGKEAVQRFHQHQDEVSLILIDVVMPVMGGVSAAQEIRRSNATVPVVFMTGYDLNSSLVTGIDITKQPCSLQTL